MWEFTALPDVAGWYDIGNQRAEFGRRGGELTFLNEHGDSSDGGFLDEG